VNGIGELAFISEKSGLPQIWVGEAQIEQLTDVSKYADFEALQWSYNSESLLSYRKKMLASLNLKKVDVSVHYTGDLHVNYPHWSLDDKFIYFTSKKNNQWMLYRVAVANEELPVEQVSSQNIYLAQPLSSKVLLFTKYQEQGLWSLNLETSEEEIIAKDFPWSNSWQIASGKVIYMTREGSQSSFKRLDLESLEVTTLAKVKNSIRLPFSVSKDGNKIYAIANIVTESAIYQIPFTDK
jgi:Tol biopolymer transport system component